VTGCRLILAVRKMFMCIISIILITLRIHRYTNKLLIFTFTSPLSTYIPLFLKIGLFVFLLLHYVFTKT